MDRLRSVFARSPALVRAAAVSLLCAITLLLQVSDVRYATVRTSLMPGMFGPHWAASRNGVGLVRSDPSTVVLTRVPGRPMPFLVHDIPNFRKVAAVRIAVEARPYGVVAGRAFWQKARVMLWSYGRNGRRLRYVPYEVVSLDGSSDWTRASLVVPVTPETVSMRVVVVQAGLAGSLALRGVAVDGVDESHLYLGLRDGFITLWILVALWVAVPMFRRLTWARAAVAGLLALTLVGAFAPQPYLTDTLMDVATRALGTVEPARQAMARWLAPPGAEPQAVPIIDLDPSKSAQVQGAPPPGAAPARSPPSAAAGRQTAPPRAVFSRPATVLLADFAPRFEVKWGHFLAFALLAAGLPFAFPAAGWWRIYAGLLLFGVAIEMVQGFSITRSPEIDDVMRDATGAAVGLALAVAWQFWRGLRKKPA